MNIKKIRQSLIVYFRRAYLLWLRGQNPDPFRLSPLELTPIEVIIPVASKDIDTLPLVVDGLMENARNPIARIVIVTPDKRALPELQVNTEIEVFEDYEFLGVKLEEDRRIGNEERGWITQQLIKLVSINSCQYRFLMWLDADTKLNRPRTFVSGTEYLDLISDEYHRPYFVGLNQVFGFRIPRVGISRVSHHAIVDTFVFKEFLKHFDLHSVTDWIDVILECISKNTVESNSQNKEQSWHIFGRASFSEYELNHLVGSKYGANTSKVYWWNEARIELDVSREFVFNEGGLFERLSKYFKPDAPYSISFHSWQRKNRQRAV